MHRQSLGSPASKLHLHGVQFADAGVIKDNNATNFTFEDHRKDKSPSSSAVADDNEAHKSQKPNQQKSIPVSSSSSSKLVHLIPILTFFCFLILYLSSHDPSNTDLGQLSEFTTISSKNTAIDSIDVDDNVGGGSMEIEKNDVVAIRSMRKLENLERRRLIHLHRKFRQ